MLGFHVKSLVAGPGLEVPSSNTEVPYVIARGNPMQVPDAADPVSVGVAVHDESHESPAYAFSLASLARPAFPVPIGVFRAVTKATYEELVEAQVRDAISARGEGDLADLLHSGETWTVDV